MPQMRTTLILILCIHILLLVGCAQKDEYVKELQPPEPPASQAENPAPPKEREETDAIQKQVETMTLEEKIGQMMIIGLDGYEIDEHTKQMMEEYHIGGFILFSRNLIDTNQALQLLNSLKQWNSPNELPLFLSIDEEGGRISRFPSEWLNVPTNKVIGQLNDEEFSFYIGKALAKKLKALGLNMNFAPVLDINSNPDNPVIGDRSFGENAELVSRLGIQTMKGMQREQIISVIKHFPGHGDTSVDSHYGLPVLDHDVNRLKELEIIPFKQAIDHQVDMIMTAHILLPNVDETYPASLSEKIITRLLREELGFEGVVISDDLTMGAIIENYTIEEAAVQSVLAGTDIILVAHNYDQQLSVYTSLLHAVKEGKISEESINRSVYRIIALKQKYGLADNQVEDASMEQINNEIKELLEGVKLAN